MSYAPGSNPRSTAHPPTDSDKPPHLLWSLDFLIFKAEIRIPAYLTEGESVENAAQKDFEKG